MKKSLILLFLLFCFDASAQVVTQYKNAEVIVSEEKANINGTIYYVHKVVPKQTLYSISKAYNISEEEIIKSNPSINEGLKAESIIFIPCPSTAIKETAVSNIVNIEQQKKEYRQHRVKWYESLKSIARKYDVSTESIALLNNITQGEVTTRQVLLIPDNDTADIKNMMANTTDSLNTNPETSISIINTPETTMSNTLERMNHLKKMNHFSKNNPVKVTLLMPFNSQSLRPATSYFDFYSGALLAVKEMKEAGMSIDLKVIDMSSYISTEQIQNDKFFNESNIIIGPVNANNIPEFAEYCDRNQIPIVSPMDHKADELVLSYPYLFQVPASPKIQLNNLISSINHVEGKDDIIFFYETFGNDTSLVNNLKNSLQAKGLKYKSIDYNILQGRDVYGSLKSWLNKNLHHNIIIASESEAFTYDVIRNMKLLSSMDSYSIELFGSQKIKNFETIEVEYFHDMNLHISAPYFVDYTQPKTKQFVMQYRALYNGEPTPYSFQGYDIVKYFLSALNDFGNDFITYVEYYPMQMLQSNIHFKRINSKSGFTNVATKQVVYKPDYQTFVK